jgi:hypothetical protein
MKHSFFLALVLFLSGSAAAQKEATLTLHNGEELSGVIVFVSDDSVYFTEPHAVHYTERTDNPPWLVFAREEIRNITFDKGVSVLTTTVIGTIAGLTTAGFLALTMKERDNSLSNAFLPIARAFTIIVVTATGAGAGFLYGLMAGKSGTTFDMAKDADYELLKASYPPDAYNERRELSRPVSDSDFAD